MEDPFIDRICLGIGYVCCGHLVMRIHSQLGYRPFAGLFFQSLRFAPCLTGPNNLGAMCTDPTKSKTGRLGSISEIFFDLKLSASART